MLKKRKNINREENNTIKKDKNINIKTIEKIDKNLERKNRMVSINMRKKTRK